MQNPSFGRLAAARFGLNRNLNVKCKNLKSYDLAFAVDRTQLADGFPMCVLQGEPRNLPGGANVPTSLFRDATISLSKRMSGNDQRF